MNRDNRAPASVMLMLLAISLTALTLMVIGAMHVVSWLIEHVATWAHAAAELLAV